MKPLETLVAAAALCLASLPAHAQSPPSALQQELGRAPAVTGGVQRFSFPRSDLNVTLDGVHVQPALALGSWLAFRPIGGGHMEVMGDLVLSHTEIKPVLQRLVAGGLSITALHNHLLRSEPGTMYMHVHGHGEPVALARTLKTALQATATPLAPPAAAPADRPTGSPAVDRAALERVLGRAGTPAAGGVLGFTIPRAHEIRDGGRPVPVAMGLGTVLNFQPAGEGRVATTGDFVMTADEVEPVVTELTRAGIEITALHNHLLRDEPRLFFMHFWGLGDPATVAGALKAALDRTNSQRAAAR